MIRTFRLETVLTRCPCLPSLGATAATRCPLIDRLPASSDFVPQMSLTKILWLKRDRHCTILPVNRSRLYQYAHAGSGHHSPS
jgi:hypothetical protein